MRASLALVPLRLAAVVGVVLGASHCRTSAAADTPRAAAPPPSTQAAAAPAPKPVGTDPGHAGAGTPLVPARGMELAAFAEGCFWGSEDTFRHVEGVTATAVGYSGGHTAHPSYEDVCTHTTGHAETVLVEYDPKRVSYAQLLRTFWESHDPTTLNRQGPDIGDQYRSEIFTFSAEQTAQAKSSLAEEQAHMKRKITTAIAPIAAFWKAEDYHQQYDEKTGRHSCPLPNRETL